MSNRIFDLMISCLGNVLFNRDLTIDQTLTKQELVEVYKLSKKHDMAHIVGISLAKAGMLENAPEIAEKFEKEQYLAVFRYENFKYEIDRICKIFDEQKIPYILLKGAVIRDYYPEPWMRTSCDLDVLVKEEDLDTAITALTEKLGYTVDKNKNFHDVDLFSESGIHLELHFNIKENIPAFDVVLSRVWDYAKKTDEDLEGLIVTNEFLLYHLIAHAAYHFVDGGCGVRPLTDIYLLKNMLEYDETVLKQLCEESEIGKFYSSVCKLCECWFEGAEHIVLTDEMQKFILQGGAYGTKEAHIAARQEARGGKGGYAMSRIFAPYDVLKQRYPKLRGRVQMPIYQVRRWIDVARDGGAKRSMQELRINGTMDIESVRTVNNLMKQLRLDKHIK